MRFYVRVYWNFVEQMPSSELSVEAQSFEQAAECALRATGGGCAEYMQVEHRSGDEAEIRVFVNAFWYEGYLFEYEASRSYLVRHVGGSVLVEGR